MKDKDIIERLNAAQTIEDSAEICSELKDKCIEDAGRSNWLIKAMEALGLPAPISLKLKKNTII